MDSVIEFVSEDSTDDDVLMQRLLELLPEAINSSDTTLEDSALLRELQITLPRGQVIKSVARNPTQFQITPQEIHWLKRHNQNEWIKYIIHRYKFRMAGKSLDVPLFPVHLLIEPTSICNLRCVMCFQIDESFTKNKSMMGLMPWELFESLIDQATENGCNAITLASRGEPTLHKQFGDMLRYIHDKGILDTKINTNATRLNEKLIHDILESEVGNVTFSVDASTAESYEKIRVRGKFDQVLANIKLFNKIRETRYPSSSTTTRISGVAVDPDQDPNEMNFFWSELVDEVTIVPNQQRWDSYNNPRFNRKELCKILYSRMYVWWDGTCNPCDFDYKSLLKVGNAHTDSLKDIWHGERYSSIREHHENMRRSALNPCDRCPL